MGAHYASDCIASFIIVSGNIIAYSACCYRDPVCFVVCSTQTGHSLVTLSLSFGFFIRFVVSLLSLILCPVLQAFPVIVLGGMLHSVFNAHCPVVSLSYLLKHRTGGMCSCMCVRMVCFAISHTHKHTLLHVNGYIHAHTQLTHLLSSLTPFHSGFLEEKMMQLDTLIQWGLFGAVLSVVLSYRSILNRKRIYRVLGLVRTQHPFDIMIVTIL